MKPIPATSKSLRKLLAKRPILWVGAGASIAAEYPSFQDIEAAIREESEDELAEDASFTEVVDEFLEYNSKGTLTRVLRDLFADVRSPTPVHQYIARLAGAGRFPVIITTNFDSLIEDALKDQGVSFDLQIQEFNVQLASHDRPRVIKVHGSYEMWSQVILSGKAHAAFNDTHRQLMAQLRVLLQQHPLLFLGCSMTDRRILDWLRDLEPSWAELLDKWRPLMTAADWQRALETPYGAGTAREPLAKARVRPLLLDDYQRHLPELMREAADREAPPELDELVFTLIAREDTWTLQGPSPGMTHDAPNPLNLGRMASDLYRLRLGINKHLDSSHPYTPTLAGGLTDLGHRIGQVLADTLFSADALALVRKRCNQIELGRARLTLRAPETELADRALALPWELLTLEPERFAVREGELDVVREAIRDGAPTAGPPIDRTLSTALLASSPRDATPLDQEAEIAALQAALQPGGHDIRRAAGGTIQHLIDLAGEMRPVALHFSGHGSARHLVCEDQSGNSQLIGVDDIARMLRQQVVESGRAMRFPRLFFLAACEGATETESEHGQVSSDGQDPDIGETLGRGPSTAATLHRAGFVHVVGYFGPVGDALCTRAEVAFYRALAAGQTLLQAANLARASLIEPLVGDTGVTYLCPLAWAQLVVYHRGPDQAVVAPQDGPG